MRQAVDTNIPVSARNQRRRDSSRPVSARGEPRDTPPTPRTKFVRDSSRSNASVPVTARSRASSVATPRRGSLASDMYNTLQTQGNAMKVYVRVRPYSEREMGMKTSTHSTVRIDSANPSLITLLDPNRGFRPNSTYSFTRCFWSVLERAEDAAENERALGIQESIDTYMNSASRARSQSLPTMLSARSRGGGAGAGREKESAREDGALSYVGSGSSATMSAANVSHPPYANQEMVYVNVGKPVLENMLDGYNGCVFAYGQTGSGKTFTMLGYAPAVADMRGLRSRRESAVAPPSESSLSARVQSPRSDAYSTQASPVDSDEGPDVVDKTALDPNELQGIIPRITADMFEGLRAKRQKDPSLSYRVEVSYYEVYNEKVYDLVRPQRNGDLKIRHNPVAGPYVEGLANKVVMKEEEVMKILRKGMQERHTAATKFNDRSSRSHAILTFSILQLYLDENDSTCKMHSKLNLVDLAGSERTGAAGAEGHEMADGIKINLSLTVLGRVIDCLADLSQSKSLAVPVPYRDSNLTWLLSDSLGGNSQTSMVATISPHMVNYEEMRQTIRYASRAKQIVNRAVRNEDPQVVQIRELRNEVSRLQQLLREAGGHEFTREYVLELERKCRELEKRCTEQEVTIGNLRAKLENAGISPSSTKEHGPQSPSSSILSPKTNVNGVVKKIMVDTTALNTPTSGSPLAHSIASSANKLSHEQLVEKVTRLQLEIDRMRGEVRDKDMMWSNYCDYYMRWNTDDIFKSFEEKSLEIFRSCRAVGFNSHSNLLRLIDKTEVKYLSDMNELERRHQEEMAELQKEYNSSQDLVAELQGKIDGQGTQTSSEQVALLERTIEKNKEIYEMERRRMESEASAMAKHYEDLLSETRLGFHEDLQRLKNSCEVSSQDRQRSSEAVLQQQEEQRKEHARLLDEIASLKEKLSLESTRSQKELALATARHEAEQLEAALRQRQTESEVATARRDNLNLLAARKKMEREMQRDMRDVVQQQEHLVTLTKTVISDWENKLPAFEADMAQLRDLMHDKDYTSFRQRAKNIAYQPRRSIAAASDEVDEKNRKENEDYRATVAQLRQYHEDQQNKMQRLQKDMYKQISKARGYTPASTDDHGEVAQSKAKPAS